VDLNACRASFCLVSTDSLQSLSLSSANIFGYCAGSTTTATDEWFFAADRSIEGPPMSMFSTASSSLTSFFATVASNG
jgi:hypothetical protein